MSILPRLLFFAFQTLLRYHLHVFISGLGINPRQLDYAATHLVLATEIFRQRTAQNILGL